MSETQEVDVTIDPTGKVKIEIRGMKGQGCLALTGEIERLLGGSVLDRTLTDEFHQESQAGSQEDGLHLGT